MLGPLSLGVTDSYSDGSRLLRVRLLGLPLRSRRGPELARGEAFRYLAEVRWEPAEGPLTYWRGTITAFQVSDQTAVS